MIFNGWDVYPVISPKDYTLSDLIHFQIFLKLYVGRYIWTVKFNEAKASFIESWGQMGSYWGINRTMAQVQALLLISEKPLCTDEIMDELNISRGNANMNIRELISWGIVYKSFIPGDRKEYFRSEKDPWEIAKKVARERKKRELEPLLHNMQNLKAFKATDKKGRELKAVSNKIHKMAKEADGMIEKLLLD